MHHAQINFSASVTSGIVQEIGLFVGVSGEKIPADALITVGHRDVALKFAGILAQPGRSACSG